MSSLSKLLLNTFAAVADLATREPDVEGLHESIDALTSKRNREDSISTKSPQLYATSASKPLSSKRKMAGKDLLRKFLSKAKPKVAKADADMSSNHNQDQNSSDQSNDECFFDANEYEDDAIHNPDNILYPNGNSKVMLEKGETLGWALKSTGHRKNKDGTIVKYKVCLGALVCPQPHCGFISRPLVRQAKKSANNSSSSGNSSSSIGNKRTKCKIHDCMLEHVPCKARITIRESPMSTCVEIQNNGNHDHPKPHRIHVSKRGKKTIHDHLQRKPNADPISMRVGTKGIEPVWTEDSTLLNMGRLRATVRKERKAHHGTVDIAAFDSLLTMYCVILQCSSDVMVSCVEGVSAYTPCQIRASDRRPNSEAAAKIRQNPSLPMD